MPGEEISCATWAPMLFWLAIAVRRHAGAAALFRRDTDARRERRRL